MAPDPHTHRMLDRPVPLVPLPPLESVEGLAAHFARVDLTGLPAEQAEALGDLIGDLLLRAQERGYQTAIDALRDRASFVQWLGSGDGARGQRAGWTINTLAADYLAADPARHAALAPGGGVRPAPDTRSAVVKLQALVAEILARFTERGHPGEPCLRTGWVRESTVVGWYQRHRESEHA